MPRNFDTLPFEELLTEYTLLQARHGFGERLSTSELEELSEIKAALSDGITSISGKKERREHLRLAISGKLLACFEGVQAEARWFEFGKGGLFVEVDPPLPMGSELRIESIEVRGEKCQLGVSAIVVWRKTECVREQHGLPNGVGLQFIDVDNTARERINYVFDRLFDGSTAAPSLAHSSAGGIAIRDDEQLLLVCRAVLRRGDLQGLWSKDGPTSKGKGFLQNNGQGLSPSRQSLLMLAWQLWNGTWDLRINQLWYLDADAQDTMVKLVIALHQGHEAVNAWLDMESQGPAATSTSE